MKTRSATKAQRVVEEEAVEPLPLDKLAPEVLNIIAEALAANEDILKPRLLGSLARSCKVIKEAVRDAKDKLKVKYDAAWALVRKCGWSSVEQIVQQRPTTLYWWDKNLTAADAPALTNVLKSKAMARLELLSLYADLLGDTGATAIAAAAATGGGPPASCPCPPPRLRRRCRAPRLAWPQRPARLPRPGPGRRTQTSCTTARPPPGHTGPPS